MWRLAILAAIGCAGAEANVLTAQTTPVAASGRELGLHPGETMTYNVQLGGVLVGEAVLGVGEIGTVGGHRAVVVKSRAATAGAVALVKNIVDESTTVIDVETGRPLQVDTMFLSGDKKITATAKFEGRIANVTYQRPGDKKPQHIRIDFRTEALHDMHTAMAEVRGWRATPGTSRNIFLVGGRRLWRIEMKYIGEETVGSAVGNRRAVVFEGSSFRVKRDLTAESTKPTRTFRVWLSDDADRVPLKCSAHTELGDIVMELTDYQRP